MSTDTAQIDAYVRHLRAAGHPDTTINTWRSPLRRAAAELPHGLAATTDEAEAWLAGLRGTISHNTPASYTVALRNLYGWRIPTRRRDPARRLHPAHLPRLGHRRGQPHPVPPDHPPA